MLVSAWPDIDAVIELGPSRVVTTRVTAMAEDFFEHHFPGQPVVPAVMQLSWLEHSVGVYVAHCTAGRCAAVLREMTRVTCIHTATPGDELRIEVTLGQPLDAAAAALGKLLLVSGQLVRGEKRLLRARLIMEVVPYGELLPPWSHVSATIGLEEQTRKRDTDGRRP